MWMVYFQKTFCAYTQKESITDAQDSFFSNFINFICFYFQPFILRLIQIARFISNWHLYFSNKYYGLVSTFFFLTEFFVFLVFGVKHLQSHMFTMFRFNIQSNSLLQVLDWNFTDSYNYVLHMHNITKDIEPAKKRSQSV